MITPFTFDPEVAATYKTAEVTRSVVSKMGGLESDGDFPLCDPSRSSDIGERRILEIEQQSDFGTSYTNAPWFIHHHTTKAITVLNSHVDHWDFLSRYLVRINAFDEAEGFIRGSRSRVNPALYAIERELDPTGGARASYDHFEVRWVEKIENERQIFHNAKISSTNKVRAVVRVQEIAAAKASLVAFRDDLKAWVNEIQRQI